MQILYSPQNSLYHDLASVDLEEEDDEEEEIHLCYI